MLFVAAVGDGVPRLQCLATTEIRESIKTRLLMDQEYDSKVTRKHSFHSQDLQHPEPTGSVFFVTKYPAKMPGVILMSSATALFKNENISSSNFRYTPKSTTD